MPSPSPRLLAALCILPAAIAGQQQLLAKRLLPSTHCLDGSDAGYYYAPPLTNSSKTWVVFLEGGGACYSLDSCRARATTTLGSSKDWAATYSQDDNLLSGDPAVNPVFWGAHKIYVPYCTGDVHGGTRATPLNTSWPFWFSGHLNIAAIIHSLAATHFSKGDGAAPQTVVVTGSSAGGIGTLLNADFISETLGSAAHVIAAPQGGWFFPDVSIFPYWSVGADTPIWSTLAFVAEDIYATYSPPACVNLHNVSFCASADNLAPYIETPMFIAENLVDSQQVFQELLAPPASPRLPAYLSYFHARMSASLRTRAASRSDWAVWAPACFDHTSNLNMHDPRVNNGTVIDGVSFRDAFAAWATGSSSTPRVLMDTCADVPCNPTCPKPGGDGGV